MDFLFVKAGREVAYNGDAPDGRSWFRGTFVRKACDDQDEDEEEQGAEKYMQTELEDRAALNW